VNYLRKVYVVYVNFGGDPSSKQTHVTEFGWTTASVGSIVQVQNLQTACQTFKGARYVARDSGTERKDLGVTNDLYRLGGHQH
jgi:hypothetical protein